MKFLRFQNLRERGIVDNRVTLNRWIDKEGFPHGRLLGPNMRVWTDEEVDHWLASRPTERRAMRKAAKAAVESEQTEVTTSNP